MTKLLTPKILLILLMSLYSTAVSAHDIEVKNADGVTIYYNWANNNTEVAVSYRGNKLDTYHNEYTGNVVIPETVSYNGKKYRVTSIGNSAFSFCSGLTSVTIPNSVTSIGKTSFSYCSGLTSVTIGNSVTSINGAAFLDCSGLTSVTIPNSVTYIGDEAFRSCSGLTSVTIPNSVTTIGEKVFRYCRGLTSVTIPNSVTSIGDYAFSECSRLTSVTIPNSVTSIGGQAFIYCSSLTSVTIPNSVTSIGIWAFTYCGLTSIVSEIESPFNVNCFDDNIYSKATLTIPKGTKAAYQATDGWKDFVNIVENTSNGVVFAIEGINYEGSESDKTALVTSVDANKTSVTIPKSVTYNGVTYDVTSIADRAFEGRSDLEYLSIPSSITSIGEYAFINCGRNITVNIESLETWFNVDFYHEHSNPLSSSKALYINNVEIRDLVIPNSVNLIKKFAFFECWPITSITIPSSVRKIDSSAFENCKSLTSVSLSNTLQFIGGSAFESCRGISSVTIPNTVTLIGINAFKNCSGLTNVISEIQTPFDISDSVFEGIASDAILTVPSGKKSAYQSTAGWKNFANIIETGGGEIADTKRIIHVATAGTLPNLISEKEKYNIEELTLTGELNGTDLKFIREMAGSPVWTDSNMDIYLNADGEREIMKASPIGKLTTLDISGSNFIAGGDSYYGKSEDGTITLSCYLKNDNELPPYVFYRSRLSSIIIPNSLISIDDGALSYCIGLISITIPQNVTRIGGGIDNDQNSYYHMYRGESGVFYGCNGLQEIYTKITNPFHISENTFLGETYSNAKLIVPKGTKAVYQAKEGWMTFVNIFEEGDEILFTIDGTTYQGSRSNKTVQVKSVDTKLRNLVIPASVSYNGTSYQVTGAADNAFRGGTMAALIWNVDATLPSNAFSNASIGSNLLLYVKSESYAPSSVKNVVVNGTAQAIVLSDNGGQFYCPQSFTARSISYTHSYSMETGGAGKGWETIVLPFNVQRISHTTRGELIPFASYSSGSNQKPFWLASMMSGGFRNSSKIEANTPYIIAMPNNSSYRNDYILAGEVTFSSENVNVPATPTFSGTFVPTYSTVTKSSNVYALNVNNRYLTYSGNYDAGSRFISNLRDVRPFEAYISQGSSTRGVIEIGFGDGTTGMAEVLGGYDADKVISIHTLNGQKITQAKQCELDKVIDQLPHGVYIVNGKKIVK